MIVNKFFIVPEGDTSALANIRMYSGKLPHAERFDAG